MTFILETEAEVVGVAGKLARILSTLQGYKCPRDQRMRQCIQERLDKSLASYQKDLQDCVLWLSNRNSLAMLRRIYR